jgi:hypothetical protein
MMRGTKRKTPGAIQMNTLSLQRGCLRIARLALRRGDVQTARAYLARWAAARAAA